MKNRTGPRAAKKFTQLQAEFDATKTPGFQPWQDLVNANAAFELANAEKEVDRAFRAENEAKRAVDNARKTAKAARQELRSLRKEHGSKSNLEAAELRDEQDRLAFISKAEDADMAAEKQPYAANSGSLGLAAPPLSQAAQDDDLHALDEAHEAWK